MRSLCRFLMFIGIPISLVVVVSVWLTVADRGFTETFVNLKNRLVMNQHPRTKPPQQPTPSPSMDPQFGVESLETILKRKFFRCSRGKVSISRLIGSGAFGKVFEGHMKRADGLYDHVAVKFQKPLFGPMDPAVPMPSKYGEIEHEFGIMDRMQTYDGFVRVYAPNFSGHWKYYIMDYIGADVDTMRGLRPPKFRLEPVAGLEIALQMLNRIRAVHAEGYVVYDIHPGNFLVDNRNKVYMVDLALAYPYKNKDGTHIKLTQAPFVYSNMRMRPLASRREESGMISSRMDDIERFLFMLIMILKGSLPWEGVRGVERARDMKLNMSPKDLCESRRMVWLQPVLEFVFALPFDAEPPYRYLDATLQTILVHAKELVAKRKHKSTTKHK